jgi:predicted RNA-binding protein with PIN domain
MSERLIILDGYNLILRTPALKPGDGRTLRESRDKLINLLSWGFGSGEARMLVVFDGAEVTGSDQRGGRVEVRFSRPPQKADDLIRDLVEAELKHTERLTVVTSDLEVARHARAMGADIALADLFLASVLDPASATQTPEKPSTISKRELEEWAAIFRQKPASDSEDEE